MKTSENKNFRLSIRTKLLLLSLAVFSIPMVGYEYLEELEKYFRNSLEMSLTDSARAVAGPLHENYQLFPYSDSDTSNTLFIHSLKYPVQLDGYTDDWASYLDWSYKFTGNNDQENKDITSFDLILGKGNHYIYAMIQVKDDKVIYQDSSSPELVNGDYIELIIGDNYLVKQHYYFSTSAPGKFSPFQIEKVITDWEEKEFTRQITNISANWQPTKTGYNLEIAIPQWMLDTRLGIIVNDSDNINKKPHSIIGTAGNNTKENPGKLLQPSIEIEKKISQLETPEGRRIWILDKQGQVMATSGTLNRIIDENPFNLFYSLILPTVPKKFMDDLAGVSRLNGAEIKSALQGVTDTRWRSTPDGKAVIISAATPIWINREVRGVVVVEETTNNIQMLQRHALVSLFNKTILVFLGVTMLLLIFASRLSIRMRRLSQEANAAIDAQGRVIGTITASDATDEIGELSRNYAAMLERLKQYNYYLESLAGKLSHELRTPMAIVQSSLENLQAETTDIDNHYLERAQEGIIRLNHILARLSEAANLEQALQSAEFNTVELSDLISRCVEGYQLAYPDTKFKLIMSNEKIYKDISDDLFVQMLDKIISNAVDFNNREHPVSIFLDKSADQIILKVINHGPVLDKDMQTQLFESMVTIRDKRKQDNVHLGLGLFIARKIIELHGGIIKAENLPDASGVSFAFIFPEKS